MKAEEIFNRGLKYWPTEIDVSDGKEVIETNGFLSNNLSSTWNEAEENANKNEWDEIAIWIIFGLLHISARVNFKKGIHKIYLSEINYEEFKIKLFDALQYEGYELMLSEYLKNNN